MLHDFKNFLIKGNAIDLAIGFMFGAAFATVVKSFVENIVMPPIGMILAGIDFGDLFIVLNGENYESLAALEEAGAPAIKYGTFLNDAIGFIILGFIIFMFVRQMAKLQKNEEEKPIVTPADVVLLTEIRDLLKK